MKTPTQFSLLASLTLLAVSQANAGSSIGVQFLGRDGSPDQTGNPGVPPVNGTAGVVPQQFWNPIDDNHQFSPAEKGESQALIDSSQLTTTVTLLFDCNDSWYNDVTPTNLHTANAMLMNGIIKASAGAGVPGVFVFTNVPEGQYDLYVYTDMNGNSTIAKYWDKDYLTTYYVKLQHQFYDTNTFIQGTSTSVAAATNACNYVKFSNLGTYGSGTIGVSGQWVSGGDGIGICGLQLVNLGPPAVNTNPVSILTQPVNRRIALGASNVTFSVLARGSAVTYQWYKNGTAVAGATDRTYTPVPASGDNGAVLYVICKNNVNSVQSSNAVITVGANVLMAGIDEKVWFGSTRTDVENGLYDTNTPDHEAILGQWQELYGNNSIYNWAERMNGLFLAPVTTNYTFFVNSDDDSDLFLSTDSTSANKRLIAQEVSWANALNWLGNDGGTANRELNQKRSDQYSPDGGTTVPYASGIPLVAGTQYYLEQVHHQGGGGANAGATYKYVGTPDPKSGDPSKITINVLAPYVQGLDGAYVVITNQPASVTIPQARSTTLRVGAWSGYKGDSSGLAPAIYYQWQSAPAGSSAFANVPGASGTSYQTAVLNVADNGIQFRAVLSAADVVSNSAIATVTVISDTNPAVVVGAGVFSGSTQIGLTFDKDVDPATAGNAANYKVNGAAVTSALVRTNVANELTTEKNLVSLTVATPITGNFTVTVTGVKDNFGNVTSNTFPGGLINLTSTDIGSPAGQTAGGTAWGPDPLFPGKVTQWGPGSFDVLCNGNDYWNNADGFHFLWEPKTNSFDVRVRVVSVSPINNWSAGAIEVREGPPTPDGGGWELARHYFCKVDYGGPDRCLDGSGTGANTYEFNCRKSPGDPAVRETANSGQGESYGWGGSGPGNPAPVPFPNAWIRIARVRSTDGTSDHMLGYSGNDGQTWSLREDVDLNDANHAGWTTVGGTNAGPWPGVCYVGLGSTCHTGIGNNNPTNSGGVGSFYYSPVDQPYGCYVIYRSWGDTPAISGPPTLALKSNSDGTITLTYTGHLYSSSTVTGTFALVSGASSPYPINPKTSGPQTTFYRAGP